MNKELEQFFDQIKSHQSISGTSLIISFYGDYLWTCGGGIWLGSLINLMDTLGFNQRVVRSSVFRLHKDEWLTVSKEGRKSYYYLEPERYNEMLGANKKIYHSLEHEWNNRWNLIHTNLGPTHSNKAEVRFIQHKGFGLYEKDFFIQPDLQQLTPEIKQQIVARVPSARIFQQAELFSSDGDTLREMVSQAWDLERIEAEYRDFYTLFEPVSQVLEKMTSSDISEEEAFKLRLLVIHFYRRIIVRDPDLPVALLPQEWPRKRAEQVAINIYHKVHAKAMEYLMAHGETANGKLPMPSPNYYIRFGGLS
ncbi:PaaX family transcriptional regulator [Vibrio sp. SCSIO 43137]|uniref:PaaX family transcriptional regulator n=1 Tax=Vibrio sp. SCSIO 43137 TaxID=3021011 RepID=UPI0023073E10|nr:PaaX family transcriptional regulator C-terminal domain-containing protein [Vibrio sp. SCSIO 43137]WCE30911.1 PaaX family transcriptional regulator C-terminal domain-containing protein [Vibrio sp. SCSIO 43137]